MSDIDFSSFTSVFSWRYASDEMRRIWSEEHKRRLLRKVWVALAEAQKGFGLVSEEEFADIKAHEADVDISKSLEMEKETRHDLMAEIKVFSGQCPVGGGKVHLGATSADILDNADAIRIKESFEIVKRRVRETLAAFGALIRKYAGVSAMAWTHLQSAECTTIGYRFALYADEFLRISKELEKFEVLGKGFKGACGNASSYELLLGFKGAEKLEKDALALLGLKAFQVTTQVYPRSQDYRVLTLLSEISLICAKFAIDMRMLQSSGIGGELREAFSKNQVGSSAMPFKRNPVSMEKVSSLCRMVQSFVQVAWENGANSILERTLDDSANRRMILSGGFLCIDEILITLNKTLSGLEVDTVAVRGNLDRFGAYSGTEVLIMEACKKGADRQRMHEEIRRESMKSYENLRMNGSSNLIELLVENEYVLKYLDKTSIIKCINAHSSLKFSENRALKICGMIDKALESGMF